MVQFHSSFLSCLDKSEFPAPSLNHDVTSYASPFYIKRSILKNMATASGEQRSPDAVAIFFRMSELLLRRQPNRAQGQHEVGRVYHGGQAAIMIDVVAEQRGRARRSQQQTAVQHVQEVAVAAEGLFNREGEM